MSRCKKCEGTGVMNRNLTPDCYITCSDCHGTGEVEDKPEMPERIWAHLEDVSFQGSDWIEGWSEEPCVINGENAPYLVQHKYLRSDLHEREIDNLKMLLEEANLQIASLQDWDRLNTEMIASMTDQLDASLPADKVMELVEKARKFVLTKVNPVTCYHRHGNKIPESHLIELSNSQIDFEKYLDNMEATLFPEGVEDKEDK